jgi:adenine-specific DNA-methyltransferase
MTQQELQQRLNQPYSTDNWKQVVSEVFPNVQLFDPVLTIPVENSKVESFRQLGNVRLQDGKSLALFELKLKSNVNILRNRVELNNLVSQYIDQEQNHGVLSIFEQGGEDYRFTFSAKATTYEEEEADFVTKKTDTKRFTYLLGKNESCKTPALRLHDLSTKKAEANIHTIQDAFSVEKLSKEFFEEYKVHYTRMVNYLIETPTYRVALFKEDDKAIRDFVKLTLGRLVFIQFLQKKRWMGVPATAADWDSGDPHFLKHSFQNYVVKDLFYSHFLEPLFYEALNLDGRPNQVFAPTGTKVPYLNGGLFEKGKESTHLINFPPALFEELFAFFDRYNFTIDESDPKEQEVGIDPEMLGHIFENLLEDNKDKGAFYTPKEIVHYMCQESLLEYLKTFLKGAGKWPKSETEQLQLEEGLSNFIKKKEGDSIVDYSRELAIALRDVKICDPAIGSGAFPMGLLTEIFQAVYLLFQANPAVVGQEWGMDEWKPNVVKKNIIQNSIYGVDIEKGAVDIARLRFWLSLIVDEPEPEALPNLDYKIVVGNSLISKLRDTVIDIDWSLDTTSHGLYGADLAQQKAELLKQISAKQKEFFNPESDKRTLAAEIRNLKIDLLINQLELMVRTKGIETQPTGNTRKITLQTSLYLQTLGWKKSIDQLKDLKMHSEKILPFFDWKLDFPELLNELVVENPGFDIVIGNPPYGQLFSDSDKEIIKIKYPLLKFKIDIYPVFIILSNTLLKDRGYLSYIIPNTLLDNKNLDDLRLHLLENTFINGLIDLDDKVFESATVHSMIFSLKKMSDLEYLIKCSKDGVNKFYYIPSQYFKSQDYYIFDLRSFKYNNLINKLKKNSTRFQDVIDLKQTIKTGNDSEFILNEATNPSHKPILRGKDIGKYSKKWNGLFVDYGPHLANQIRSDIFEQPKILIREAGKEIIATFDDENYYIMSSLYNGTIKSDDFSIKFVLALINSKIYQFLLNLITLDKTKGAFTKARIFHYYNLPVKNVTKERQSFISKIVDEVISKKSKNEETAELEREIDNLVYHLYELSYEEVNVIDPDFYLSEEEYNAISLD